MIGPVWAATRVGGFRSAQTVKACCKAQPRFLALDMVNGSGGGSNETDMLRSGFVGIRVWWRAARARAWKCPASHGLRDTGKLYPLGWRSRIWITRDVLFLLRTLERSPD